MRHCWHQKQINGPTRRRILAIPHIRVGLLNSYFAFFELPVPVDRDSWRAVDEAFGGMLEMARRLAAHFCGCPHLHRPCDMYLWWTRILHLDSYPIQQSRARQIEVA
jgi:hypothetical protein